MMRTWMAFLWLYCLPLFVFGQFHSTITYTIEDGLPHSELTHVFADSRGMIWVGSAGGITRFDGREFHTLTERDGLPTRTFVRILEDDEGKIWLQSGASHGTNYQFLTVLTPDLIIDTILNIKHFAEESGRVFYNKHTKKINVSCNDNEIWEYNAETKTFELHQKMIFEGKPIYGLPYVDHFNERWVTQHYNDKRDTSFLLSFEHSKFELLPASPLFENTKVGIIGGLPGGGVMAYLRADPDTCFRYTDAEGWTSFYPGTAAVPPNYSSMPCFGGPSIILCNKIDDVTASLIEINECFPDGVEYVFKMPEPYLRALPAKSKDGSYWIATRNGLKRVFPQFLDCLASFGDNRILDLHGICEDDDGKVWFASYSYGFTYFDGNKINSSPPVVSRFKMFLPGSYKDEDGFMYFALNNSKTDEHGILKFDGKQSFEIELKDHIGYYFHRSFDNELGYGMSRRGLAVKNLEPPCTSNDCWTIIGEDKGFGLTNALTTVKDRYGRWWMGRSSTGIAYYDPLQDSVFNFYRKEQARDYGAMSSLMDKKGNLWFGTDKGLCFFENRENIDPSTFDPVKEFTRIGIESMGEFMVTSLIQVNDNTLLAGNEKGFGILDLKSFYDGKPVINFIGKENGYTGGFVEQNAVWKDRSGRIWIGSDEGAHRFDPNLHIWDDTPPEFTIDSVLAGDIIYSGFKPGKVLKLKANDNALKIFVSADIDSLLRDNVFYEYNLKGYKRFPLTKETVFEISGTTLDIPTLDDGKYTLEIWAVRNNIKSKVKTLTFKIPKHWYEYPWNWGILLVLFGIVIRYYERSLEKQKSEKNKLQIQAIVNQLNPHFINNALQWVQVRVYNDQEAVKVISKLGENIRIVFKNSREKKPYHSLADEMKLVENYLFIQKQRFGDNLEYNLPEPSEIAEYKDIHLPLMQIQIHCENAVEHGIRNKEDGESGVLKVQLTEEKKHIRIVVEDNGIGRRKAAEIGSKGTQRGTKMLEDLKNILNKRNTQLIRYEYEDDIFKNSEGQGYGTRMNIWIPKKYNYELD